MRLYFFDILLGNRIGEDDKGKRLPDLAAVQKEALSTLSEAAKELTEFPSDLKVQVRDQDGPVAHKNILDRASRSERDYFAFVRGYSFARVGKLQIGARGRVPVRRRSVVL
jgi:hypothetical protein